MLGLAPAIGSCSAPVPARWGNDCKLYCIVNFPFASLISLREERNPLLQLTAGLCNSPWQKSLWHSGVRGTIAKSVLSYHSFKSNVNICAGAQPAALSCSILGRLMMENLMIKLNSCCRVQKGKITRQFQAFVLLWCKAWDARITFKPWNCVVFKT